MSSRRVLVIGSGGREHALAWKLAHEADVHAAPGNPGFDCERHPVALTDFDGIEALARQLEPDLVLIGPEDPLVGGLADRLRGGCWRVFGPGAEGARLEGSKAYAKDFMAAAGIPCAQSGSFTDPSEAADAVRRLYASGRQAVVKASGNALGKGVVVASDEGDALEAVRRMMVERSLGSAAETVVIEERLSGREFSLLTICSESGFRSLPPAQDYKRIGDGDRGPNTGGMGSYSPVDWVGPDWVEQVELRVVQPAIEELARRGIPFRGVLFSGMMLGDDGPKCLEFNVRFGDPETQAVVRRLGAGFLDALSAAADGEVVPPIEVRPESSVCVVLANAGYPGPIQGRPEIVWPVRMDPEVVVFHAGTAREGGALLATGGRVLGVTATGPRLATARESAYRAAESIRFEGKQFRSDIALG